MGLKQFEPVMRSLAVAESAEDDYMMMNISSKLTSLTTNSLLTHYLLTTNSLFTHYLLTINTLLTHY